MKEILAVILLIAVLLMFLVNRYSPDNLKKVEEPIATCGVSTTNDYSYAPDLFKVKCMTCHNREKNTTSPALVGIENRQPYPHWFSEFVTNQDSLVYAEEPYTKNIMGYSPVEYLHNFKELGHNEIDILRDYLQN